ncbi:MAG: DUF6062 family protein [Nitrososphaeria archaeon]
MEAWEPKKSKDIFYVLLKDAILKEDCPICFLLNKGKERWIDNLLYEHVTDPNTREKIRNDGFCRRHLWDIFSYSNNHPGLDGLGISIIMQDVLESQIGKLIRAENDDKFWGDKCILCKLIAESEENYLASLISWLEAELLEVYKASPSILCLNHFRSVSGKIKYEHKELLLKIQLDKLEELNRNLKSFISKSAWDANESPTFKEASAKELAGKVLRGGVY